MTYPDTDPAPEPEPKSNAEAFADALANQRPSSPFDTNTTTTQEKN